MEVVQLGEQFNNESLIRIRKGQQIWLCCSEVRNKLVPHILDSAFRMVISQHGAPRFAELQELRFLQEREAITKDVQYASLVELETACLALKELLGDHILVASLSKLATATAVEAQGVTAAAEPLSSAGKAWATFQSQKAVSGY